MKNKFKTAIVLFAVLTGMLLADCAMAQEKGVRVKVGADFHRPACRYRGEEQILASNSVGAPIRIGVLTACGHIDDS